MNYLRIIPFRVVGRLGILLIGARMSQYLTAILVLYGTIHTARLARTLGNSLLVNNSHGKIRLMQFPIRTMQSLANSPMVYTWILNMHIGKSGAYLDWKHTGEKAAIWPLAKPLFTMSYSIKSSYAVLSLAELMRKGE